MPYQLFQPLEKKERIVVAQNIDFLTDLIDQNQKEAWINFLSGEAPQEKLKWKGSLQEAYYFFNEIRIATLAGKSLIQINTKNRGLDWVKINKIISTRFGKIQKESRPSKSEQFTVLNEFLRLNLKNQSPR